VADGRLVRVIDPTLLGWLKRDLIRDEGKRRIAYRDTLGYWTIGVGRLIDERQGGGLSDDEIDLLLTNDIHRAYVAACTFDWFAGLDPMRQRAIVNLLFNLGPTRFRGFTKTIAALDAGNFTAAADHLQDSLWYRQVGARADRLIALMRIGPPAST